MGRLSLFTVLLRYFIVSLAGTQCARRPLLRSGPISGHVVKYGNNTETVFARPFAIAVAGCGAPYAKKRSANRGTGARTVFRAVSNRRATDVAS